MSRRWLIPGLLLTIAALTAAACGGSDEPPVTDDPSPDAIDSGEDRPLPATDDQPTSPIERDDTVAPGDDDAIVDADRPSAEAVAPVAPNDATTPATTPATTADGTYTVQAGDTLGDIAFRFGTTAAVLADLNSLENPNSLVIGQVLVLPGGELPTDDEETTVTDAAPDGDTDGDTSADPDADAASDDPDAGATEPDADPPPAAPPTAEGAGLSPAGIPQPGPDVTTEDVPDRPAALTDFATTALPWLQDRTTPDELLDLFVDWSMPPLPRGDRFTLLDTDADGLFSLVAIFTDPGPAQRGPGTDANLVVYDPVPGQPTRWRQAFDHNLAHSLPGQDYSVLAVEDMTGDNRNDILYSEVFCGASTCTTSVHLLVRDGDGYREAAVPPIDVPTVTSIEVTDATGDDVLDLTIEGGTFGSVGAGPVRPFAFVFSGVGDNFVEVSREGLPTEFLVWVVADGNAEFDRGDYALALTHYTQAASDSDLDEFVPDAGPELIGLAQLRTAIARLQLGDTAGAVASAQAASAGSGLLAELATAYFGAIAVQPDAAAGCAALNEALALRVADWDAFWGQFGFGLPAFRAEQLCPF